MVKWIGINQKLQVILSQEIDLRREILGTMNRQESVLLSGDTDLRTNISKESSALAARLKNIVKQRGALIRKLFNLMPSITIGTPLEEALDPLIDLEGETLYLYQKAQEIIDKIHRQHLRNKSLHAMIGKERPFAIYTKKVQEKRISLITIDYPKKKEPT